MSFKVGDRVKKVSGSLSPYIGVVTHTDEDGYLCGKVEWSEYIGQSSLKPGDNFGCMEENFVPFEKQNKKTEFKIGQKVAVYDTRLVDGRQVGVLTSMTDPNGSSKSAFLVEHLNRVDGYQEIIVNPKQVRRIKERA